MHMPVTVTTLRARVDENESDGENVRYILEDLWRKHPFQVAESTMDRLLLLPMNETLQPPLLVPMPTAVDDKKEESTRSIFCDFYHGRVSFPEYENDDGAMPSSLYAPQNSRRKRRTQSFRLDFAYDGRCFCGWQRQCETSDNIHEEQAHSVTLPSAQRVVEERIESAFGTSDNKDVDVRVAGRTDSGVHAFRQIGRVRIRDPRVPFNNSLTAMEPLEEYLLQLLNSHYCQNSRKANGLTSPSWRCWSVTPVNELFHPQFRAKNRSYVYLIDAYAIASLSNIDAFEFVQILDSMLRRLEGIDLDYYSFSYGKITTQNTICRLEHARARYMREPTRDKPVIAIELTGNRFLRRMVRILVNASVRCALNHSCPPTNSSMPRGQVSNDLIAIALARDRYLTTGNPRAAPASGLVFVGAQYENDNDTTGLPI